MIKHKRVSFILILVLAFFLRFYQLGLVPASLNWDENSNAYNAYSILKTGKDEYGNFLPLTNRSFDDYKPPLYMYLNIPTVSIFGLTPQAARLPSAFFGFLTVVLIYFLTKFIFRNQKQVNTEFVAQMSMLLLAISPWHVHFSRIGFEANVGLFSAVAAITTFLYGLKNIKVFILSAIIFGIAAYSYHSVRIYLPLLLLAAVLFYRNDLKVLSKKILIIWVLIVTLLVVPLFIFTPFISITQRYTTATSELRREEAEKSINYMEQDKTANFPFENIIHNRRVFTSLTVLDNYLWHFDFNFLFTKGDDNLRHHIQGQGMFYLWQLPFVVFGIYQLIKKRTRESLFIFAWLLIAPLAAAPARPSPHAVRSLAMVIPLTIIIAYSISALVNKKTLVSKVILALTLVIGIFSFISYEHDYFVHYPLENSSSWQYGYSIAAAETEKLKDQYEKIRVDGKLEQAYAFWLFTSRYDPAAYQKNGSREGFGKYIFNSGAPTNPKELFVTVAENFPPNFEIIKVIKYPNGQDNIVIGHPRSQ